jgi:hypothetical protein
MSLGSSSQCALKYISRLRRTAFGPTYAMLNQNNTKCIRNLNQCGTVEQSLCGRQTVHAHTHARWHSPKCTWHLPVWRGHRIASAHLQVGRPLGPPREKDSARQWTYWERGAIRQEKKMSSGKKERGKVTCFKQRIFYITCCVVPRVDHSSSPH